VVGGGGRLGHAPFFPLFPASGRAEQAALPKAQGYQGGEVVYIYALMWLTRWVGTRGANCSAQPVSPFLCQQSGRSGAICFSIVRKYWFRPSRPWNAIGPAVR